MTPTNTKFQHPAGHGCCGSACDPEKSSLHVYTPNAIHDGCVLSREFPLCNGYELGVVEQACTLYKLVDVVSWWRTIF